MLILNNVGKSSLFLLQGRVPGNSVRLEEADVRPVACVQNKSHRALRLSLLPPVRAEFRLAGAVVAALPFSHAECYFVWILPWLQSNPSGYFSLVREADVGGSIRWGGGVAAVRLSCSS